MLRVKTILHPTDFSDFSEAAFQLPCTMANDYGARLLLTHVAPPQEILHGTYYAAPVAVQEDVEAARKKFMAIEPTERTIDVEHFFLRGDPAEEILYLANKHEVDLIVLGTHGRTGLSRVFMGSVAEQVLRKAECPVVTVKKPFPLETTSETTNGAPAGVNL